jgi:hypothetical protein
MYVASLCAGSVGDARVFADQTRRGLTRDTTWGVQMCLTACGVEWARAVSGVADHSQSGVVRGVRCEGRWFV